MKVSQETLADRILTREGLTRQALAEDADLWRTRRVVLIEIATRQDWNTHRMKETGANGIIPRGLIFVGVRGFSLRQKVSILHAVGNVGHLREGHVLHAGQGAQPLFDLMMQLQIFRRRITRLGLLNRKQHEMIRTESGIDVGELEERPHKEKSPRHQQCRQHYLEGDDHLAGKALALSRAAWPCGLQASSAITPSCDPCWHGAEEQPAQQCDARGERQHGPVERHSEL